MNLNMRKIKRRYPYIHGQQRLLQWKKNLFKQLFLKLYKKKKKNIYFGVKNSKSDLGTDFQTF